MMPARFSRETAVTLGVALAVLIAMASPAAAVPGDLDPTFDQDGKVTTDFADIWKSPSVGGPGDDADPPSDVARGIAVQADGKIIAAGVVSSSWVLNERDFALVRYNPDGSLDSTFDGDGRVTTDISGGSDQAEAVAIQGDGKIVVAGSASVSGTLLDFALARYNPDGSLDPSFGGDGKVTTDFAGAHDVATAMAIQDDGKIVVTGGAHFSGTGLDFLLARYNPDGSLDATFDGDGKVTTDFTGRSDLSQAVAIQRDGRIVAAGYALLTGAFYRFTLARYNTDGSLDSTFGGDGKALTTNFGGTGDYAEGLAIQGDGKIVAAGYAILSGIYHFALARYNLDGSLDTTFDGDGKVTTAFGLAGEAASLAIQGDGKIVAAGGAQGKFALARYNPGGSLDSVFGGDGMVTTEFAPAGGESSSEAEAVAIQADGKIVAAGYARMTGGYDFALARYTVCRPSSGRSSIPCR